MSPAYDDHVHFAGGQYAGPVIGKIEYRRQAAAPTALDSLPARAAGFTGRDEELARLLDALSGASEEAVLVAAVSGLGGIGKTALAVAAAHEARGRGWFPGGVLFVDLHGYDEAPVSADQALQSLLRALGVEPEHIPATADERAALYRSLLARWAEERGAVLILADNASSPEQVRPLLPGDSRHRVLVTSREQLPQLQARLMSLDQLTAKGAYELLDCALRIAHPADRRISGAPEAVTQLSVLCGHLPLALQIAAALLAEDPHKPVAELAGELAASRDRLDYLDDGDRSVRAAFDLSYRRLPAEQARLLRLLAHAPGPEVSDEVVAALVGAEAAPSRELRALARAHLVEQAGTRGWWRLHDLVRAFGLAVVAADAELREEGMAARKRVLEFYDRWAREADARLRWLSRTLEPGRFADQGQALAWLDGERAGLVAAAQWVREERFADTAGRLVESLGVYLDWRRFFDDWIAVSRVAQEAAHRVGDRRREARAWDKLGSALQKVGRLGEAIEAHTRARDLCQAVGDHSREAIVWTGLGIALQKAGRVEEAFDAHTRAHALCQTTGNHGSEALAWTGLGLAVALGAAGRLNESIEAHVQAHDRFQTAGNRSGEALAWAGLGVTLWKAGRVEKSVPALTQARDLFQAVGDRPGVAQVWRHLGHVLTDMHKGDEAIEAHTKAVGIWLEVEDWYRAGEDFLSLVTAHVLAGRRAEAIAYVLRAADAFTRANAGDRAAHARAWAVGLGNSQARERATTAPAPPPAPTDRPAPASPPAHKPASARPSPPPPGAPDTAEP